MHCLRSYFVCQFPGSGYFFTTWRLKQVKQISAKMGNFYWSNWVETSWSGKQRLYMTGKRWEKKAKPWVEIVTYLTPGNLIVSRATSVRNNPCCFANTDTDTVNTKLIASNSLAFSFEDLYPEFLRGHLPSPFSGENTIENPRRCIALMG